MVGSGGHASLVAVHQPQLGGSGSSTRSHGGWVRQRFGYSKPRQRVAAVAVRQPQFGSHSSEYKTHTGDQNKS